LSVGPPDASISIWITDPTLARETITLDKKGRAIIQRKPTTAPATQPLVTKGTVFLLHGIADRKEFGPYMIYREILTHDGYRVVQVDLRGHGRSTGDFISFGVIESRDLVQVLDALDAQGKIIGPVGVLGVSYGASVAIEWAAIDPRVRAIVALEPFTTFRQVSHDAAPVTLGLKRFFFSKSDIDKAVNLAGKLADFNPDEADAVRAIQETRAAVLLIHSRADQLIPYAHSERLYDAATGDRRLLLLDRASHFDMWIMHLETISTATLEWLKAKLPAPTTQTSGVGSAQ
jgi:pimeloyl-ACP methyl ester carboxylesterase